MGLQWEFLSPSPFELMFEYLTISHNFCDIGPGVPQWSFPKWCFYNRFPTSAAVTDAAIWSAAFSILVMLNVVCIYRDVDRSPDKPGNHLSGHLAKSDPVALLAKQFNCSKRNALLKWCQNKTATYSVSPITCIWDFTYCADIPHHRCKKNVFCTVFIFIKNAFLTFFQRFFIF